HWSGEAPESGVFAVKADAVAALSALGINQSNVSVAREAPGWFHPGRSGALKLDAPIAGFELYLDALPSAKKKGTARPALEASDLQAVRRDFAFLLDRDVAAADVLRAASGADRALVSAIEVFDVFTGQGVPEGKKSLAIEVTLQPRDK